VELKQENHKKNLDHINNIEEVVNFVLFPYVPTGHGVAKVDQDSQ